ITNNTGADILLQTIGWAIGDYLLTCPTKLFAMSVHKASENTRVFEYYFNTKFTAGAQLFCSDLMGVCHYDDVYLAFGLPFQEYDRYGRREREVSAEMIKAFTSFAWEGKPTVQSGITNNTGADILLQTIGRAIGDYLLTCPTKLFAMSVHKASENTRVFEYYFNTKFTVGAQLFCSDWMGVCHYDDVYLAFGLPFQEYDRYGRREREVSAEMIKAFTSFAWEGKPTVQSVVISIIGLVVGRDINNAGLSLIKEMEGDWRADYYYDEIGQKTIGYGHCCVYHTCDQLHPPLTEAQVTQLLRTDLAEFQNCVQNAAPGLNDNQFAACTSFAFDMGCGTFNGSHVLSNIKAKNFNAAAKAFNEYVSVGGRVIADLVKRRKREAQLFRS
ncbi:unnamed protein product, partial [Oppiella nova]